MRTQLFSFRSPAVQWMARTSSLNCLSCRNPYQTPASLNCLPPSHWKNPFFTEKCFVASPSQKSALINVHFGKGLVVTGHEKRGARDPFQRNKKGTMGHRTVLKIKVVMSKVVFSGLLTYRKGTGVAIKGVTGRDAIVHKADAIVHKRQRNTSQKELIARHFPSLFQGFETQVLRKSWTLLLVPHLLEKPFSEKSLSRNSSTLCDPLRLESQCSLSRQTPRVCSRGFRAGWSCRLPQCFAHPRAKPVQRDFRPSPVA